MVAWPSGLPQEVAGDNYVEAVPNNAIRSLTEVGPAKVRKRSTSAVRPFVVMVPMSEADIDTLDTFFVTTLSDGTIPFTWTHPRTGAAATFRFINPPQYKYKSGLIAKV